MYRQSPSRNQRSKGISVKHFVQYSLLLGVCIWLLYHLKHSHEKNLEGDRSERESLHVDEIMKHLGRKGMQDRVEETVLFEVKIEETNSEEDDSPFEGEAGGVEETEKNEPGESSESDDEMTDGEKVRAAVSDDDEVEEETDQEEENVPEVREDNYKADDVSNAVTHDSHWRTTENEKEGSEHTETDRNGHDFFEKTTKTDTLRNLDGEVNDSENGNELENGNEVSKHGETDVEDISGHDIPEETTNEGTTRDLEGESNGSENGVQLKNDNSESTVTEGSGNLLIGNNSTDLAIINGNETIKNATESAFENSTETEKLEHRFEDGSDQSSSSNSAVSTDTLDETVEFDMDANQVSDTSSIRDNSTSETNEEDGKSERVDKDGNDDDTDTVNEMMDTIKDVQSGETSNEGDVAE